MSELSQLSRSRGASLLKWRSAYKLTNSIFVARLRPTATQSVRVRCGSQDETHLGAISKHSFMQPNKLFTSSW